MTHHRAMALLLLLDALTLAAMVPGGLVETRSFPAYPVAIIAAFNVFLTVLAFATLILAWRAARAEPVARGAALAGIAYCAVYLLDLGEIFPVTAAPMSTTLANLEILGTLLGLATVALALRRQTGRATAERSPLPRWLWPVMGLAALGIVLFATHFAA